MPNMWDEKPLRTDIQIELRQDGATVNFSRLIISGVVCYRITPTFIQEIIDMLKFKITEKEFLHHLTLNLKSPHNHLTENHKNINLEEVYIVLESSVTEFLKEEVNNINELALKEAKKIEEEKNSGYCSVM